MWDACFIGDVIMEKLNSKEKWKARVHADTKRYFENREAELKAIREKNAPKKYEKRQEYKFPEKYSMKKFFWLPKNILSMGLSNSAIAVYPVLCGESNFTNPDDWFHLTQETIGTKAGLDAKTVRKAIEELEDKVIPDPSVSEEEWRIMGKQPSVRLLQKTKVTTGELTYYLYNVFFYRTEQAKFKNETILFNTCITESSYWQVLSNRAKVLYLVLRYIGEYDPEYYEAVTGEEIDSHSSDFLYRRFDVVWPLNLTNVCKLAKIRKSVLPDVLEELKNWGLVYWKHELGYDENDSKYCEIDTVRVYLKPKDLVGAVEYNDEDCEDEDE